MGKVITVAARLNNIAKKNKNISGTVSNTDLLNIYF